MFSVVTIAQAAVTADELKLRAEQLPYFDEVIELTSNQVSYPALWQPFRTATPQGTVLMLHDQAQHALWPDLLSKLRLQLPDNGWNTLSISVPSNFDADLMQQVRELLASRGQFNVVVLGIGHGSTQALEFMTEQIGRQGDFGWYLIMVNHRDTDVATFRAQLQSLTMPVLDLWVPDTSNAQWLAKHRLGALRRSSSDNISQIKSAWPMTKYDDNMDHMARRVWGWIRTNAAGQEANVEVNPRY